MLHFFMADVLSDAIPAGVFRTPADVAVFVGVVLAESGPLPGVGAMVAAVTSVALEADLPLADAAPFVRGVRDVYVGLVSSPVPVDRAHMVDRIGHAVVDGLAAAVPSVERLESILDAAYPRYQLILETFLAHSEIPEGPSLAGR